MMTIENERRAAAARILELAGERDVTRQALRFVLELRDRRDDGKWDAAAIARLDAARALAGLPRG